MPQKKDPIISEKKETIIPETPIKSIPMADPAALGLIGLAVAALVLGSVDLQLVASVPSKSLMIPWILFFGATAQLIAGGLEFKRNNIFGATVFSVYAMTMYAIALTLVLTTSSVLNPGNIDTYAFGLIGILVFSLIATVASLMTNKVLFAILIAVDLAYKKYTGVNVCAAVIKTRFDSKQIATLSTKGSKKIIKKSSDIHLIKVFFVTFVAINIL